MVLGSSFLSTLFDDFMQSLYLYTDASKMIAQALSYLLELQTSMSTCLFNISIWMSSRHLQFSMLQMEFSSCPSPLYLQPSLPSSFTLLMPQNLESSLISPIPSYLRCHVSGSPLCSIFKIIPEYNYFHHLHGCHPSLSWHHLPCGLLQEPPNWSPHFHSFPSIIQSQNCN